MGTSLEFKATLVKDILGDEAVARLMNVSTGRQVINRVADQVNASEVNTAIDVVNGGNHRDVYLGQELVGMIVNRDPEEYRDNPAPAVMLAAAFLSNFNVYSKSNLNCSIVERQTRAS